MEMSILAVRFGNGGLISYWDKKYLAISEQVWFYLITLRLLVQGVWRC